MAEFRALGPNVEVNGQTVLSIVNGMGAFRSQALEILKHHGIDNPAPNSWHKQQAWLDAFKEIHDRVGSNTLYQIGMKIPENAEFPPQIDSVEKALGSIEVAYHMNHRGGEIGHYNFVSEGANRGKMVCPNPYPCEFDKGLIAAMAKRFAAGKTPTVTHDDTGPCRQTGGESCTYRVAW